MLAHKNDTVEIDNGVPIPEAHTVMEATETLKVSRSTVYLLIDQGELTRINIGKKALIYGVREFVARKLSEARQNRAA